MPIKHFTLFCSARSLGMSKIKMELEDLSLKYIDPIGYYEIVDKIAQKQEEREQYILEIIEKKKKGDIMIKNQCRGKRIYEKNTCCIHKQKGY